MKYKNALIHSLLVGLIAAFVILVSGWLAVKAWVVFFGWANYFLHACNMKKSFKMLLAFFIGIFIALIGTYAITHLNTIAPENSELYVTAFIVFWIATILIFLEIIEDWGEFVPATFLGTVLFFASGVSLKSIIPELFIPLLIGIFAGFTTLFSREKLTIYLNK
ncbi:membrane hypothetical protein [Tenacibaculum dicentrarchi]|uniref:DUF1097 domain-containing protein n=1 Tax=Tenacibaculum dicentrarchi TaxID=669041 RepID=A0ABP1ET39_9FLAO|nr:membrane hypothetical protein [Tenacibaculum dicentrarchi]